MKLEVMLALLCWSCGALAAKTHFIYWNTTNPIFRIDNTDHIVDVNRNNQPSEYDQLHLICPTDSEQHVVYSVSKEEFEACRVTNPRPKIVAVCDQPQKFMYFTITFRSFSPTPGGLEFKPGQTYYLISTSNRRDIHRRVGGYCSTHNMKMVFNVADNTMLHRTSPADAEEASRPTPAVNTDRRRDSYLTAGDSWSTDVPQKPTINEDYLDNDVSSAGGLSFHQNQDSEVGTRRPQPSSTTSIPVYYYRSRTPAIHSSDYIYYYSPRDLVQLKLRANSRMNSGIEEVNQHLDAKGYNAQRLTSAASLMSSLSSGLGLSLLTIALSHLWRHC